jgi:hypothetical protein
LYRYLSSRYPLLLPTSRHSKLGQIPPDVKENLIEKNIILNVIAKPWDEKALVDMIESIE